MIISGIITLIFIAQSIRYCFLQTSDFTLYIGLILQVTGMSVTILVALLLLHIKHRIFIRLSDTMERVDLDLSDLGINISYQFVHTATYLCATLIPSPQALVASSDRKIYIKILDMLSYSYCVNIRVVLIFLATVILFVIRERFAQVNSYLESLLNDYRNTGRRNIVTVTLKLENYVKIRNVYENLISASEDYKAYFGMCFLLFIIFNYIQSVFATFFVAKGYSSLLSTSELIAMFLAINLQLGLLCILAWDTENQVMLTD